MNLESIALPEVYKESSDFRLFIRWFATALSKVQYDTENLPDLYDALRCPDNLLWMLADTIGFKYDDRLPTAYNRLVLLYFMSMIRNRGSKDGVTLAAEVNLAQFNILDYGAENEILYNRLEDTSIPVNAAYVTPHTDMGYIDVVYFSTRNPIDACIEYVRPLGMYLFATPGVRFDARTKISVDPRLSSEDTMHIKAVTTRVGHYTRKDYASLQKMENESEQVINSADTREKAWYRNSEYEQEKTVDAGYRALSSLQLCNNEHIVKALLRPDDPSSELPPIFGLGYTPTEVEPFADQLPLKPEDDAPRTWNLRYDKGRDIKNADGTMDVRTIDDDRTSSVTTPRPCVNPIMYTVGDAISKNEYNTEYILVDLQGIPIITADGEYIITVDGEYIVT